MHLYLIRHGETEMNIKGAYYGALDTPINGTGRQQAQAVGAALEGIAWDGIYISEKIRTRQTAEIAVPDFSSDNFCILPEFNELDFGLWEGLTNVQVSQSYPEAYQSWCSDWLHTPPPEGECFAAFYERVCRGLERVMNAGNDDRNILICAHNGTLRALMARMCSLGPEGTWHFHFEQDAYSRVDFECNNFTIRSINVRR